MLESGKALVFWMTCVKEENVVLEESTLQTEQFLIPGFVTTKSSYLTSDMAFFALLQNCSKDDMPHTHVGRGKTKRPLAVDIAG